MAETLFCIVSVANYQLLQKRVGFEVLILLPGCKTY